TPALIVVGDVIRMREAIAWFETRPLFGKRIVVTRAREQASGLVRLLAESGAQVVEFPTIEIAPPASFDSLDRVFDEKWDWLIFTSVNGVTSFASRMKSDVRALAGTKIAAVGQSTANELRARGIRADLVPEKFQSIALLPHFPEKLDGVRIAVIRAEEGRDELLDELRKRGAEVHLAVAYRTIAVAGDASELHDLDVVTFTSSSTVDNFFAQDANTGDALFASIGPMTSDALRKHGRGPDVEAEEATVESLHDAIVARFA
ncbi:MAG TPA: uroporphyrinogen-III synthase, partial [Thermoanaerobaculia bacterium]|nr:uroporphyrinogen-III synthase [Thermoanaerobaculia bacterium]